MFVIYEGDGEVIVTTTENEPSTIEDFFTNGGRTLQDYSRNTVRYSALRLGAEVSWR